MYYSTCASIHITCITCTSVYRHTSKSVVMVVHAKCFMDISGGGEGGEADAVGMAGGYYNYMAVSQS